MKPGAEPAPRLNFDISKAEDKRVAALMRAQGISRAEAGRRFFQLGLRCRSTKRTSVVGADAPKELSSCLVSDSFSRS